jgi:hypothetical protein
MHMMFDKGETCPLVSGDAPHQKCNCTDEDYYKIGV